MERIDRIISHPLFLENIEKNRAAEAKRRFCRHDMAHFLDVARIGTIISLEEDIDIPKALIYGAALLHDIGKHVQYEKGIPHEQAGAVLAPEILLESGFGREEAELIRDAILQHRNSEVRTERNLRGILYRADKASRACFSCSVSAECNWKNDKKNKTILY